MNASSTTHPRAKPIHGTTEQCMRHFADALGISNTSRGTQRAVYRKRNVLADGIFHVHRPTLHSWFSGDRMPEGMNVLKLREVLKLCGYRVAESEALSPKIQRFAEYIAYGVTTVSELVAADLGLKAKSILRPITGHEGFSDTKLDRVLGYLKRHDAKLEERKRQWRGLLAPIVPFKLAGEDGPHVIERTDAAPAFPVPNGAPSLSDAVQASGVLVKALLPFAEFLASDKANAEHRDQARKASGGDNLFKLSTLLNMLCSESERARQIEKNHK